MEAQSVATSSKTEWLSSLALHLVRSKLIRALTKINDNIYQKYAQNIKQLLFNFVPICNDFTYFMDPH